MSRMFMIDGKPMKTWNVFKGCRFECTYCNARKMALTRLKHLPRYWDGFAPRLLIGELDRRFRPGEFIFVGYMGDISFATRAEVTSILARIDLFPETSFLFCSKNPAVYLRWRLDNLYDNLYLGTTIETNRNYGLSKAPSPWERFLAMAVLRHTRKFISIEPIMDFDLLILLEWLRDIRPEIIEVGADNYHNHLTEPSWEKVEALLRALRRFVPRVVEKDGLQRLKGDTNE